MKMNRSGRKTIRRGARLSSCSRSRQVLTLFRSDFPLVYSTLRLGHALWGLDPLGYHLVNVLLHAANAFLVWVLLRKLAVPGAGLAAALFAFHPVQVESVAWIAELKNTQSTLFSLLALLMWVRFLPTEPPPRRKYYWLALLFYVLALLSKTTACTLVAALFLLPWMQGERIGRRRRFNAPRLFLPVGRDHDVPEMFQSGPGRDQMTHDHVLLQSEQVVHLPFNRRIGQDLRRFLE